MQNQPYPSIVFVTGNANKLKELVAIAPANLHFDSEKIDLDEVKTST